MHGAAFPLLLQANHRLKRWLRSLLLCLATAHSAAAQCNTPPTAVADAASTPANRTLWVNPLANDSDPDGQPLFVSVLNENCPGAVTKDSTGLLTYLPAAVQGREQHCSITYSVRDGAGGSDSAVVRITVIALIFADGFESGDTSAWSDVE